MRPPRVALINISYNRPIFLDESVKSAFHKPGYEDFTYYLWDNNSNEKSRKALEELCKKYPLKVLLNNENIGQQALQHMIRIVESEYIVFLEDDLLWFQDNWLKDMVDAMDESPFELIATNVIIDEVNNGALWQEALIGKKEETIKGRRYWSNVCGGAGPRIVRTQFLRDNYELLGPPRFFGQMGYLFMEMEKKKHPMAYIPDTYTYHATSPFFNQLYPEVWLDKTEGKEKLEKAWKTYKDSGEFNFENKEYILDMLKKGKFREYATEQHAKI